MFDPWVVLSNLSDPVTLLLMTLSACFGIIMGAVPGLSGTLGIALLLPFTFGLESATALLMLGSVYCGSEYGGSIPSILINTPGTAAALCTTFDGYPMAMKGQAQKALFTALISSVFGGIFGVSALLFLSVPLAVLPHGRLVQQQQLRLRGSHGGNGHPALLSLGKGVGMPLR